MTRLIILSLLNFIRNPLRQAVLYPWVIITIERWIVQTYNVPAPHISMLGSIGYIFLCAGIAICVVTMGQFIADGAGTAEGYAPPVKLISGGIFRWTRNPLYLGMAITLFAEAVVGQSLSLLVYALIWTREFRKRVRREEESMLSRFGQAYVAYASVTPRWLPFVAIDDPVARTESRREAPAPLNAGVPARELKIARMVQKNVIRTGSVLTLFAALGYVDARPGIFSAVSTPFLWFDPNENLFHLIVGLPLLAAGCISVFRPLSASANRSLLVLAGTVLLIAAIGGFSVADRPFPNVLGVMNFENPVENVIHWVAGAQCLFAAGREYLLSVAKSRSAVSRVLSA